MTSIWIAILSFIAGVMLLSTERWVFAIPFLLGSIFLWIGIIAICGHGPLQYCGIVR